MRAAYWGPVHPCPKCGEHVSYGHNPAWRFPRLYEAGSFDRHQCANAYEPPTIDFKECLCGGNVDIVGGVRYDRGSDQVHICYHTPAVVPIRKPVLVVVPDVDRIPRGAIVL